MKVKFMILIFFIGMIMPMPLSAFECPKLYGVATKSIKQTEKKLNKMNKTIPEETLEGINFLLEQSKKLLAEGKVHHEEAKSKFNHALSVAKIRSAYGHSLAANMLIVRSIIKM